MSACRIILADDHALFRACLRKIIEGHHGLEVIGEAGDGLELLELLNTLTPEVVILDLSMPNLRGLEAIPEIKKRRPEAKVLVLTMHRDKDYLRQAVAAGADGYMVKEDADPELFSAIKAVKEERIYISQSLCGDLIDDWAQICRRKVEKSLESESLSLREKEILKLVAEGKSSREIAASLSISNRTVERHRADIMGKLNVKTMADLIKYAIKEGYL